MKCAGEVVWVMLLIGAAASGVAPQSATVEEHRLSLAEARGVIDAYADALPEGMSAEAKRDANAWARYLEQRETELQARLEQGDLDTLANLLLFGTSYTKEPVLTPALLQQIAAGGGGADGGGGEEGEAYPRRPQKMGPRICHPTGKEPL